MSDHALCGRCLGEREWSFAAKSVSMRISRSGARSLGRAGSCQGVRSMIWRSSLDDAEKCSLGFLKIMMRKLAYVAALERLMRDGNLRGVA